MTAVPTVAFVDLTGSTRLFEVLGNAKATDTVTRLTQWIGAVCRRHQGHVVKNLGDGVLAVFPDGAQAVAAAVELHREHARRLMQWPQLLRTRLQIGLSAGEIVEVEGDCFGDAVNVASRLSDLSGADQIWANDAVVAQVELPPPGVRLRSLGPIALRGRQEPMPVFRIEWQEEVATDILTTPAVLDKPGPTARDGGRLRLTWLDQQAVFRVDQLPIHIGRVRTSHFEVNDPRVSRVHAHLHWRQGAVVLEDVSSYGTWVRFVGSDTELALRRETCVLHADGEMALGAPFADFTVPTVRFERLSAEA